VVGYRKYSILMRNLVARYGNIIRVVIVNMKRLGKGYLLYGNVFRDWLNFMVYHLI